jgi:hypothetical protein
VLERECGRLARSRAPSRLNRRAKGFSFSRGRITAGRPELHHFGGHNPIASQPAVNAAF